jgi:glycolate oxidase
MSDLDRLTAAVTTGRLLTDPGLMDRYRRDEAHLVPPGKPVAVLLAADVGEVSAALAWANDTRTPVVPRGAGSGLAGGAAAIDGCLVVCTERMTAIRELAAADEYAVVEAGVVNADLDRAAAAHGLMYAPDPSSHEISTIGGNVATNAGGLRCVKYGVTRDAVLGLEVVLADGRVIDTGRRTVKGVAGYDLTGLFVGSEGTLGVVTAATVRLRPRPAPPTTILGSFDTMRAAAEAVAAVVRAGVGPSLLELVDRATLRAIAEWKSMALDGDPAAVLIAQTDGPDAAAAAEAVRGHFLDAGAEFAAVSDDAAEAAQLLEIRRLAYPAAERLGQCLVEDVGVPRSRLPELIEEIERAAQTHDVRIMTVAHAGDGNVHPTFVFDRRADGEAPPEVWAAADDVFRAALQLGGTLTGEHGIGALKQRWLGLELGNDVLDLHRAVKAAFDPRGVLNPGRGF